MAEGFESLRFEVILQAEAQWTRLGQPGPPRIGTEHPRVGLVAEGPVEHADHPAPELGILDGDDHLDPPVEVALHEIGGPDPHPEGAVPHPAEPEQPGVLEVAADDGADPDPVGQPGDAGTQAAPLAHDEVDGGTRLRGPVEGVDHRRIGEAIGLEDDATVRAGRGLLVDGFDERRPGGDR